MGNPVVLLAVLVAVGKTSLQRRSSLLITAAL